MLDRNSPFFGAVFGVSVVKRRASPEEVEALVELVFHLEQVLDELVVAFEQIAFAGTDVVQRGKGTSSSSERPRVLDALS